MLLNTPLRKKVITKTTNESQTSPRRVQTSTDESQTTTYESQTTTDESQTTTDASQTNTVETDHYRQHELQRCIVSR